MAGRKWFRVLLCAAVLGAGGCVGAVDRADFEQDLRAHGGGLVSTLVNDARTALNERLHTLSVQTTLVLLTAPNSSGFRLVLLDQPNQVTRFMADNQDLNSREPAVRLRVRDPEHPRQLDDYSFTAGALSSARPVRVSAVDDLETESFTLGEVTGLARVEQIVDAALAHSELTDAHVSVIVASRFGTEIRIVANVVSPRAEMIAEFDQTGAFLRVRQG